MAYYRIDLNEISHRVVRTRVRFEEFEKIFKKANCKIDALSHSWYGVDSSIFKNSWNKVTVNGSVYDNYFKQVGKYYHYLTKVSRLYAEFQSTANQKSLGN